MDDGADTGPGELEIREGHVVAGDFEHPRAVRTIVAVESRDRVGIAAGSALDGDAGVLGGDRDVADGYVVAGIHEHRVAGFQVVRDQQGPQRRHRSARALAAVKVAAHGGGVYVVVGYIVIDIEVRRVRSHNEGRRIAAGVRAEPTRDLDTIAVRGEFAGWDGPIHRAIVEGAVGDVMHMGAADGHEVDVHLPSV